MCINNDDRSSNDGDRNNNNNSRSIDNVEITASNRRHRHRRPPHPRAVTTVGAILVGDGGVSKRDRLGIFTARMTASPSAEKPL